MHAGRSRRTSFEASILSCRERERVPSPIAAIEASRFQTATAAIGRTVRTGGHHRQGWIGPTPVVAFIMLHACD